MYGQAFIRLTSLPRLIKRSDRRRQLCPQAEVTATSQGPTDPPPSYSKIDANPFNVLFTRVFQSKLENELGRPAKQSGYDGVIETVRALAVRYPTPSELQLTSERVLLSLFPGWLPPAFSAMFSKPFPAFAAWINAAVTIAVTQWLMGPSRLDDDGATVHIERCRYLEGRALPNVYGPFPRYANETTWMAVTDESNVHVCDFTLTVYRELPSAMYLQH